MKLGSARIGLEKSGWYFTVAMWEELSHRLPDLRVVDADNIVEKFEW